MTQQAEDVLADNEVDAEVPETKMVDETAKAATIAKEVDTVRSPALKLLGHAAIAKEAPNVSPEKRYKAAMSMYLEELRKGKHGKVSRELPQTGGGQDRVVVLHDDIEPWEVLASMEGEPASYFVWRFNESTRRLESKVVKSTDIQEQVRRDQLHDAPATPEEAGVWGHMRQLLREGKKEKGNSRQVRSATIETVLDGPGRLSSEDLFSHLGDTKEFERLQKMFMDEMQVFTAAASSLDPSKPADKQVGVVLSALSKFIGAMDRRGSVKGDKAPRSFDEASAEIKIVWDVLDRLMLEWNQRLREQYDGELGKGMDKQVIGRCLENIRQLEALQSEVHPLVDEMVISLEKGTWSKGAAEALVKMKQAAPLAQHRPFSGKDAVDTRSWYEIWKKPSFKPAA